VFLALYLAILFSRPDQLPELKPLPKLSDYKFFVGDLSLLKPGRGVVPYTLNTSLFSNYAEKERFVKVPEGTKAVYNDSVAIAFPRGTYLIKNFFYYNDFRDTSRGRRIMETRLLVNTGNEWEAWPYVWNDAQTEAYYDVAGERQSLAYVNAKGRKISTTYYIPNKNECKGCHSRGGKLMPLGPTARNLNMNINTDTHRPISRQLEYWQSIGLLEGDPKSAPRLASEWNEKEALDQRARAYLDVNCGGCHNRLGPASTSGLYLDWKESDPAHLGIMKSPVAAGRGSGDFLYDIDPGNPGRSILVYRMKTLDPGIAMPEIGREQIHAEGVKLIEDWIKTLKK
jgi:uncharacterized repeat protein (TIGR03806 family)